MPTITPTPAPPKPDKPEPTCATCPCYLPIGDGRQGRCRRYPAVLTIPSGSNCPAEWSQPLMRSTDVCWEHPGLRHKPD
jgi:hypothetical protein